MVPGDGKRGLFRAFGGYHPRKWLKKLNQSVEADCRQRQKSPADR